MIAAAKRAILVTVFMAVFSWPEGVLAAPITSAQEVKKLSASEVGKHPQVRIEGVVTYYDPERYFFFVQDGTAGIYIRNGQEDLGLRAGDLVRIEGVAHKGGQSHVIAEPAVTRLGRGLLPEPKEIQPAQFLDPATDCDRVRVSGVLRSVAEDSGRLIYYVAIGEERALITIMTLARGEGSKNIGRKIVVNGVHAVLFNERREKYSMRLLCHSLQDVSFDDNESTTQPNELRVVNVKDLANRPAGALMRAQIIVDEFKSAVSISGHDATGSVLARTTQGGPVLPGAVLDVAGYVVNAGGNSFLDDAHFQRIGFGNKRTFSPGEHLGELPLIESVADLRRMPAEVAEREFPVRLRGVITYYDANWRMCFVQGATEGIYVHTHNQPLDIAPGQLVIVSGYSAPGDFAPMVVRPKFDVLGKAPMPAPKTVLYSELLSGAEDSQWVQMECVVRSLKDKGSVFDLEISPRGSSESVSLVSVPKSVERAAPPDLVGSVVELQAVCATEFDNSRRLKGIHFLCPAFRYITVLNSAEADPFALPLTAINSVFQFHPNAANTRRQHVLGSVTWTDHHGAFFVQDATGGLKAEADGARVHVGERVHVVGFRNVTGSTAGLSSCVVHDAGEAAVVAPTAMGAAEAVAAGAQFEGRLLRTRGQVLEKRRTPDGLELLLRDRDAVFSAALSGPISDELANLESATTLELTGVGVFEYDANFQTRSMQLLARTPADIRIVKAAPIWTSRRMEWAAAFFVAVSLLGALWIAVLRNRLARHKAVLDANMENQRALEAKVLQSQKMESIGNLAGGIAHDFNNMLMVILGYTDVLNDEQLSPDGKEAIEEINRSGKRAAELTRQLLVFSRKQLPETAVVNLNETVEDVSRMLSRLVGEDITLTVQAAEEALFVNADKGMLEQVLMNLAVNSRDAMPKGGSLVIKTERRIVAASEIVQPSADGKNEFVCLTVSDTGSGISEDDLPKIFDPFFTTKEVGKGTGLGLATVYGIVKQHNGWITVKSRIQSGTTFTIFLPIAEAAPHDVAEPRIERTAFAGEATILLVEDEDKVRRLAAQALKKAGYEVIEANSAPAALDLVEAGRQIDLLISDVIMPGGMTGADLAERMRQMQPSLPIILTSGYSEFRGKALQMPEGAFFLQKPYSPDQFLKTVDAALSALTLS
jgi:two-component system cell cycle sensor histidine kinase/response regulator CckA